MPVFVLFLVLSMKMFSWYKKIKIKKIKPLMVFGALVDIVIYCLWAVMEGNSSFALNMFAL